ncbi:MAG: MBL fold metallo-hydrolase [Patescibacteria group bacterium]
MPEELQIIQVRGENEEGISFFYGLGRIGLIIDAGISPLEDITRQEIIDVYKTLNRLFDAILLTHTHVDHARAAVWVALEFGIPIYTTSIGKKFLAYWAKKDEIDLETVKINIIQEGDQIQIGRAKIKVVQWEHSTPGALGFDIYIGDKHILHLGDGKLTGIYPESYHQNLLAIQKVAEKPIDILTMDALGIERRGLTPPEFPVIDSIAKTVLTGPGKRHFIFMYGSNTERLQGTIGHIMGLLEKDEYKETRDGGITFLFRGTAIQQAIEIIAEEQDIPNVKKALERRDAKTTVVFGTTGGEYAFDRRLLQFSKMNYDEPRALIIRPGDNVIFSSGFIPHPNPSINKKNMNEMREFFKNVHSLGANIYVNRGFDRFLEIEPYVKAGSFTTGGHEKRSGLASVISVIKPKIIIPFHLLPGGLKILKEVAEKANVLRPINFSTMEFGYIAYNE